MLLWSQPQNLVLGNSLKMKIPGKQNTPLSIHATELQWSVLEVVKEFLSFHYMK